MDEEEEEQILHDDPIPKKQIVTLIWTVQKLKFWRENKPMD